MELALQLPRYNTDDTRDIAPRMREAAQAAEEAGFSTVSVMDHYFQIPGVGDINDPMFEGYTMLGYIAAHTRQVKLGTLVTGVIYREPAFLIKQATTLDVLSGGRAFFGVGAGWFEREAVGLGFPFPPIGERFVMLEELLQIARQMWAGDTGPYEGTYYTLAETRNMPRPIQKPYPPILIGGGGEKKTLKLVARYADACNLFGADIDSVRHKLGVLRGHCEREGRNYEEIEKTVMLGSNVTGRGHAALLAHLRELSELGIDTAFLVLPGTLDISEIEEVGRLVIPEAAGL